MKENILKLTNATYKVLEFFPEADPLKNRAKDKALEIVENPTAENIDLLLGYLWVGKQQGWLSQINYLIIYNEYEKIVATRLPSTNSGLPRSPKWLARNDEGKLTPRQTKILEFLAGNEKAQVMDLQKVLPNITKRTIRRDLDELLKTGKITRMGEFNQVFYRIK